MTMQIGGTDYVIVTTHPVELMEAAVRWLLRSHPRAVIESCTGRTLGAVDQVAFGTETELFVRQYPDAEAEVVHLLRRPNELTVVTDVGSVVGAQLVDVLTHTKFPGAP